MLDSISDDDMMEYLHMIDKVGVGMDSEDSIYDNVHIHSF